MPKSVSALGGPLSTSLGRGLPRSDISSMSMFSHLVETAGTTPQPCQIPDSAPQRWNVQPQGATARLSVQAGGISRLSVSLSPRDPHGLCGASIHVITYFVTMKPGLLGDASASPCHCQTSRPYGVSPASDFKSPALPMPGLTRLYLSQPHSRNATAASATPASTSRPFRVVSAHCALISAIPAVMHSKAAVPRIVCRVVGDMRIKR